MRKTIATIAVALLSAACTAPLATTNVATTAGGVKAFPGAEGFGTDTAGGRGGDVCQVTNLNDSGAGSLRACVNASGPRTVIFRTGGTITLDSRLEVTNPHLTIAGQTAPGDGITLANDPSYTKGTMLVSTHDVVIRYIRFRTGKSTSPGGSHDALTIYKAGAEDVVVDHASLSWSSDEVLNTYDESDRITVSNSIISEGLNDAGHSKGVLSGGSGAHNVSLHHNLIASHDDRCPQISGLSVADVRNNVIYNCGDGSGEGTTLVSSSKGHAEVNWVGNYYKPGPVSPAGRSEFAMYEGDTGRTQQWYGDANVRWTSGGDEPARVEPGFDWGQVGTPFAAPAVTTASATQAYDDVLAGAGASFVRDAVDKRIVADVKNGTGQVIDHQDDVGGYPTLAAGTAPTDSDGDGMPDAFEDEHGTDPATPDANGDVDGNGYTNVEDWFNGLVGDTPTEPVEPTPEPTPTEDPVWQNPSMYRESTSCGVVAISYNTDDEDNTPSDFEILYDGTLRHTDQLNPGQLADFTETLDEDSSDGSVVVVGKANGDVLLNYTVSTDCEEPVDPNPEPEPTEVEVWLNGPLSCPVTEPVAGDTITCTYEER